MITRWMVLALLGVGLAHPSAADEAPVGAEEEEAAQQVAVRCTVCHGEDLIRQQRLTEEQWRATVEKMIRWGAQAQDVKETLVTHLSRHYGPDAGPYAPRAVEPQAARAAVAPLPDGPFAGGDAGRGRRIYEQDCLACHGPNAGGQIGVMRGNQRGQPGFANQFHQRLKDRVRRRGVEVAGRLICQKDAGAVRQSAAEGDALLFASR